MSNWALPLILRTLKPAILEDYWFAKRKSSRCPHGKMQREYGFWKKRSRIWNWSVLMLIALLLFTVICTVTENVFGLSVKNFGPINIYTLFWCQTAPYIIKVKENCNSPGMFTHDSYVIVLHLLVTVYLLKFIFLSIL